MRTFFISTPLFFEKLAIRELEEKWQLLFPHKSIQFGQEVVGGFEIQCELQNGCELNRWLKIPNRILLRLDQFKCRDTPKLYNKIAKFNWSPYLRGQIPQVKSVANHSRLFDDRKIENAIQDGVKEFYRRQEPKKYPIEKLAETRLYLRFENDICTLSLDTTGEHLHKRGYRHKMPTAPLRENLAAAMYYLSCQKYPKLKEVDLWDPMCGSGTLLFEAFSFYHPNNRFYICDSFISPMKVKIQDVPKQNHFGRDKNSEVIQYCLETVEELGAQDCFDFKVQDFFDSKYPPPQSCAVICNPPYGERLEKDFQFDQFENNLKMDYWSYISTVNKKDSFKFFNNGLDCWIHFKNL